MSLDIDVDHVEAVLIHGVWFPISDQSFEIDEYTFSYRQHRLAIDDPGPGFRFTHDSSAATIIAGPLSAVEAVRYPKTRIEVIDAD